MTEAIAIDFRPGEGVVPSILTLFDSEGYVLQGIRLVPSDHERATLRLDVGDCPPDRLRPLEQRLVEHESIIEVIHRARACC